MENRERFIRYVTGAVMVLAGLLFLLCPKGMLHFCLRLFGTGLVAGACLIAWNYHISSKMQSDFLKLLGGLAAAAVGILFLFRTSFSASVVAVLAGIAAIGAGSFLIYTDNRRESRNSIWMFAAGIVLILAGISSVAFPWLFMSVYLRAAGAVTVLIGVIGLYRTWKNSHGDPWRYVDE